MSQWNLTPIKAIALQRELASQVILKPLEKLPNLIAGVDVAYYRNEGIARGSAVILKFPELDVIEIKTMTKSIKFPYIPGLLSFREIPVLVEIFKKLKHIPELIICDGQGIAHPRRLGLASHLGLLLNIPTIGCAKKVLIGEYKPVGQEQGSQSSLFYKDEEVGILLRSRKNAKPIIISPGHLIDLKSSLEIIKKCITRYRLPEPTRLAHQHTQKM